ncbi:MAG TPA: hypothetical protein P5040_06405 [Smithella sp.]|nr:hypothetical protein [Smithella sp.]HRS97799.1 hypothetical protein [Smithella sp.]
MILISAADVHAAAHLTLSCFIEQPVICWFAWFAEAWVISGKQKNQSAKEV